MFNLLTDSTSPVSAFDFSTLDFSSLIPTLTAALAVALPICVGVFAIKKGVNWVMGFVKRA